MIKEMVNKKVGLMFTTLLFISTMVIFLIGGGFSIPDLSCEIASLVMSCVTLILLAALFFVVWKRHYHKHHYLERAALLLNILVTCYAVITSSLLIYGPPFQIASQ